MRFIALKTWTSDINGYNSDCDVVLVSAGWLEVKELLEKIALAAKLKEEYGLDATVWYDDFPYFLSNTDADLPEEIKDKLFHDGVLVVNKVYEGMNVLCDMEQKMDTVKIFVDEDGVHCEGHPRYTGVTISTAVITKEFLEGLQKEGA